MSLGADRGEFLDSLPAMKNPIFPPGSEAPQPFDEAAVERLAALMTHAGLSELRVVRGPSSVHLVKAGAVAAAGREADAVAAAQPAAGTPSVPSAMPTSRAVCAPLYGIAHLQPAPGQAPFVSVGSPVLQGETLLLIEAMKTFHEVVAHRDGVVTAIHVASGQEVQAGEALLEIGDHV